MQFKIKEEEKEKSKFNKKILLVILALIPILRFLCINIIGGMIGVYAWNISVFIFAPLAVISILPQILVYIFRLYKRKDVKWSCLFLIVSLIIAYPLTIVLGNTTAYPKKQSMKDAIEITMPIKDGIALGSEKLSSHAILPSECYAYDIVKEPYIIGSNNLNDYGVYLADVFSPVSGTIIGVENSQEDTPPNSEVIKSRMGNYVFIEVEGTGNYMILANLAKDSIPLKVGDTVKEGAYIGRVGNSGTSSAPHLHIQYQSNNPLKMIYSTFAEGLPIIIK